MSLADNMPNDRPQDVARRFADLERQVRELQAALQITKDSLGNELLKNPVRGDVLQQVATGFSLTTTGTTPLASSVWTVPAGFTTLAVNVTAKVFAYNKTASLDYLSARARITRAADGAVINGLATPVAASASGGSATSIGFGVGVITVTEGDTITLDVQGWTAFANWTADAGNIAQIIGSLTWYR